MSDKDILDADDDGDPDVAHAENEETFDAVGKALVGLWDTVNSLSKIRPPVSTYYRVSVFGSARIKPEHDLYEEVKTLAQGLSSIGCDIITGGGPGLMQAANEGENLGDPDNLTRSIGIRVELPFEDAANPYVEKDYVHKTFFTRLHQFVRMSNAFIVVGGGIGTTLELLMIWQLLQVRHIDDMPLILVGDMWHELVVWARANMLGHEPAFASAHDLDLPQCVDTVEEAIAIIEAHKKKTWDGPKNGKG